MSEVLVIGAGLAGISVAMHLAPQATVRVLEQGRSAGQEASAQNAGMLRRLSHGAPERALALRSAPALAEPPWGGPAPLRVTGAIVALAEDADTLEPAATDLRRHGVRVEQPDATALSELAPALAESQPARIYYLPDEGLIDAHGLLTGMWEAARRHGARLSTGQRVERLLVRGGRVAGVHTTEGPVQADHVVLASGAWTGALVADLGLHRPLTPLARHLFISERHSVSNPRHPWVWFDDAGLYVRPEAGGWLSSPCDEQERVPAPGPDSWGPTDGLLRSLLLSKLGWHLPALGEPRFTRGWTGLRTFAPDRAPYLGADPELTGLWWATGLGGFGVSGGYAAGEAVATWFTGGHTPWLDAASVAPGRPLERDRPEVVDALAGLDL